MRIDEKIDEIKKSLTEIYMLEQDKEVLNLANDEKAFKELKGKLENSDDNIEMIEETNLYKKAESLKIKRRVFRSGIRKSLTCLLRGKEKKYDGHNTFKPMNEVINHSYCGEGFYAANYSVGDKTFIENVTDYDINWSYGSVLRRSTGNVYPLNDFLLPEDHKECKKTACFIIKVGIKPEDLNKMSKIFKQFEYTIYLNFIAPVCEDKEDLYKYRGIINYKGLQENLYWNENDEEYVCFFNNVDYDMLKGLYHLKMKERCKYFYQNVGLLSPEVEQLIDDYYSIKQILKKDKEKSDLDKYIYKTFKTTLETAFYGKNAETVKMEQKIKGWVKDKEAGDRNEFVAIASFQAAYARKLEYDMFTNYNGSCLYMNGDSFITNDKNFKGITNIGSEVGQWKKEFEDKKVCFINRNQYIAYDENDKVYKMTVGGADSIKNENGEEELFGFNNKKLLAFLNNDKEYETELFRSSSGETREQQEARTKLHKHFKECSEMLQGDEARVIEINGMIENLENCSREFAYVNNQCKNMKKEKREALMRAPKRRLEDAMFSLSTVSEVINGNLMFMATRAKRRREQVYKKNAIKSL